MDALLPLTATGMEGEYVAGVRYRAWQPPSCLHPIDPGRYAVGVRPVGSLERA